MLIALLDVLYLSYVRGLRGYRDLAGFFVSGTSIMGKRNRG